MDGIECQLLKVTTGIVQFLLHVLDNKVENSSGTFDCGVEITDFDPLNHTIGSGLGISMGTRLYPCPIHEQSGRVWAPPMDTKAYPNPIQSGRISMDIHVHG